MAHAAGAAPLESEYAIDVMDGKSMVPTMLEDERFSIDTTARAPARGDIIVFHPPIPRGDALTFVKRVMGTPGDTVAINKNRVWVNGEALLEPYIATGTGCEGQFCTVTLGNNQYYVLGDNRRNSSDSRFWGTLAAEKIIGTVVPPERE